MTAGHTDVPRQSFRLPFALIILVSLAAAAVAHALPAVGLLLPVKLAVATAVTLVVPGAVILRIVGWPRSLAAALPACLAFSVTALAPGLVVTLTLDRGFYVAIVWLLLVVVVGLIIGRRTPVIEVGFTASPVLWWVIGGVLVFAALVWLASISVIGDAVEHIARMRKLTELDPPRSLAEINLLPPDSGLHPGYAFPLWHAAGAVIAEISGTDVAFVFRYWSSLLVPFAAMAMYGAGRTMFGCRTGGVLTLLAYLAQFAFPFQGVGYFMRLDYPGNISIFMFWPLIIDRTFDYVRNGGREPVATAVAASFCVTVIHASYTPFMMLLLGGFLVARVVMQRDTADARRIAVMLTAVSLPFLLFLIWLYPIASSGGSSHARKTFATLIEVDGNLIWMKPEWVTRGGAASIAALVLAPVVAAAARTRAAAFIASGTAIVILILIVPWFFTPLTEAISVSQGRRLLFYLPWAFALAGGALVVARGRQFAVAAALVAGIMLQTLWPGDASYSLVAGGPEAVAWLAALGSLAVAVVAAFRRVNVPYQARWALPVLLAFVLPVVFAGFQDLETAPLQASKLVRTKPLDGGLTFPPETMDAIEEHVARDDVLLADLEVAYRLNALTPVFVVAVRRGHGGDSGIIRHDERRSDVGRFFRPGTDADSLEAIVNRWNADWVLVRNSHPYPREFLEQNPPVHRGKKFTLYPLDTASAAHEGDVVGQ